jgi:arsenical pump membrane protein
MRQGAGQLRRGAAHGTNGPHGSIPNGILRAATASPPGTHGWTDYMTWPVVGWTITAIAVFGVIVRPLGWPEFIWAVAGAALLVAIGIVPPEAGLAAVGRGTDVYLFLIGMMLLSEVARDEGLFDWLAALAVHRARGSALRLFAIVYAVGIVVTTFLSNDATAVVLTPAVAAAARTAKAKPLPYLLICAFIANAASFVLPISNPANLVLYGAAMPPLAVWFSHFALPSIGAIVATYFALRWTQREALATASARAEAPAPLGRGGRVAALGIAGTAVVLLVASTVGAPLGFPTFAAGAAVALIVLISSRTPPARVLKGISWSVLPLVAGLFVLVEGLDRTGVIDRLAEALKSAAAQSTELTAVASGAVVAIGTNLVNNLPLGLVAATTSHAAAVSPKITEALLLGVDLGPNLSVTGSLATILWLIALRREGITVGALEFLKLGLIVMPPALVLALGALLLEPRF